MLFAVALAMIVDVITQADLVGLDFPSFYSACRGAQQQVDIYDVGVLARLAKQDGLHLYALLALYGVGLQRAIRSARRAAVERRAPR